MKKICWIGPIINKKDYDKYHSQSVAANEWQLNFINSIIKNKRYVINISYVPSPFFPKGPLYVKKHNIVKRKNFKQISIGYLNILFLRDLIIGIKSIFKIINLIRKKLNIQILISYNAEFKNRLVLIFFKKLFNFSSIIILADDYLKGKPNLVIFLSHKYYKLYNGGPKYYFEGGISKSTLRISRNKISDKKIILYSGSQSKLTNLEFTIEIFLKSKLLKYELHIFGRSTNNKIEKLCENNYNVKQFGFVSDEELNVAANNCFAFINPRNNNELSNNSFPSKILYYLKFNKPIISSNILSIDKKYDDFLFKFNDLKSFKSCIKKIEKIDLNEFKNKVLIFKKNNSWESRTRDLIKYSNKKNIKF